MGTLAHLVEVVQRGTCGCRRDGGCAALQALLHADMRTAARRGRHSGAAHDQRVLVVDYGVGNLLSVCRAFEACGAAVELPGQRVRIAAAERVVVPGVGAFGDCVDELERKRDSGASRSWISSPAARPVLGICVGMQMLLEVGEEFGEHQGLGVVPGRVRAIPATRADGTPHKIPAHRLERAEKALHEHTMGRHNPRRHARGLELLFRAFLHRRADRGSLSAGRLRLSRPLRLGGVARRQCLRDAVPSGKKRRDRAAYPAQFSRRLDARSAPLDRSNSMSSDLVNTSVQGVEPEQDDAKIDRQAYQLGVLGSRNTADTISSDSTSHCSGFGRSCSTKIATLLPKRIRSGRCRPYRRLLGRSRNVTQFYLIQAAAGNGAAGQILSRSGPSAGLCRAIPAAAAPAAGRSGGVAEDSVSSRSRALVSTAQRLGVSALLLPFTIPTRTRSRHRCLSREHIKYGFLTSALFWPGGRNGAGKKTVASTVACQQGVLELAGIAPVTPWIDNNGPAIIAAESRAMVRHYKNLGNPIHRPIFPASKLGLHEIITCRK